MKTMNRKGILFLLLVLCLLLTAAQALAADAFAFTQKSVTIFEGERWQAELKREGLPAEAGELTFSVADRKIAEVAGDGTVTGLKKGQTKVTATLKNGKKTWKAQLTVTVARRVTKVTLSTKNLTVLEPTDPLAVSLLKEETEHRVLLLAVGKTVNLSATCTPEDASSRKVTYTSSDAGVAKVGEKTLKGIQAGECDLVVASQQNPEITETFRVLVFTPVKKITLESAGRKSVPAGESLQLKAVFTPADAAIQQVTWTSKNPKVATVDENGRVTGVKKGSTAIRAVAADGSGKEASMTVTVTQTAEALSLKSTDVSVTVGGSVTLSPQITPASTDDKSVTWYSSDESIATVRRGQVSGVKAGTCEITCVSNSNPLLSATARVTVIQLVTKIEFLNESGLSFPVNTSQPLFWTVYPADATIPAVRFSSSHPKIATVDENGVVTGWSRGSATITATATDGSGRKGTLRVNVIQPVEGVSIQYRVYHIQLDRSLAVKALIEPSNANDTRMTWYTGDDSIAEVQGSKNVGTVYGLSEGTTTVTGVTVDGNYSASAEIRVADFNGAVLVEEVRVVDGEILLLFRNISDFAIEEVSFIVDCYDEDGNPLICNADGENTFFEGTYRGTLRPRGRTDYDLFEFKDLMLEADPGMLVVHITGWKDSEGYRRNIQEEEDQPKGYWSSYLPF